MIMHYRVEVLHVFCTKSPGALKTGKNSIDLCKKQNFSFKAYSMPHCLFVCLFVCLFFVCLLACYCRSSPVPYFVAGQCLRSQSHKKTSLVIQHN